MTDARWEGDETGSGISDGEAFAPPLRALLEEMARPDWNTEAPEAHLLPHLLRHLAHDDSIRLVRTRDEDGIFVVELEAADVARNDVRRLVYPLIATIAEPATAIIERADGDAQVFDVTLALVPGGGPFPKGHGHLVRFVVALG